MSGTATPVDPAATQDGGVDHEPRTADARGRVLGSLLRDRALTASLLAATVVLPAATWWSTSLKAYDDVQGGYSVSGPLLTPGTTLLVGLGPRPLNGSVTLVDVTPIVTSNTARATFEVRVCDEPRGGLPPGVVRATAEQYCGRPAKVDGSVHSAVRGGTAGPTPEDLDGHIVVEITPQQAGAVEVRGARVSYRDGLRRQTQSTGATMRFTSS